LNNVLIGEVWFCSGQSNMEMPLAGWGNIQNFKREIALANYPNIRFLQVKQATAEVPQQHAAVLWDGWNAVSPNTIPDFSATAYFFARELYEKTGIPIGLIHSSWGGTFIEAWSSSQALAKFDAYASGIKRLESKTAEADYKQELGLWNQLLAENDLGFNRSTGGWTAKDVDDADWNTILLPQPFDKALYPGLDGIVYFRKTVNIPDNWVGKELQLSLGPIDDNDFTFVNGTRVGATEGFTQNRNYVIPAALVTSTEVKIAIKVFDGAGDGGLYGSLDQLKITGPDLQELSIAGPWKLNVGLDLKKMPAMPSAIDGPNRPTVLFNAMVNPFKDVAIRGVIWYQGESNAERDVQRYRQLFPAMIQDWRSKWQNNSLPFYFVQLANYREKTEQPKPSAFAEIRDAQANTLKLNHTGMAVIADVGDAYDIHPKNKQEVGRRLGLIALRNLYGKHITAQGPQLKRYQIKGDQAVLTFDPLGSLLVHQPTGVTSGFTLAGKDRVFYPAAIKVIGNTVFLTAKEVPHPVAIRYGFADNPDLSIFNKEALPASPFRTDDWWDQ